MRREDLKRLHALNREIEHEKRLLATLKNNREYIGIAGIGVIRRTDYSDEITALSAKIDAHVKECFTLYNEILDFINAIGDPLIRLIISLRYINALEWGQIALHIGGGNTKESVRKTCERFLSSVFGDAGEI